MEISLTVEFFKNKIYGHLVKFKALNKNLIELKVQRKN